jgi:hypothetical protein
VPLTTGEAKVVAGGTTTQTCERSWRVINSMAWRPRWSASWRSAIWPDAVKERSSSMKAASSTTMPTDMATSSSMSVNPCSSEARLRAVTRTGRSCLAG